MKACLEKDGRIRFSEGSLSGDAARITVSADRSKIVVQLICCPNGRYICGQCQYHSGRNCFPLDKSSIKKGDTIISGLTAFLRRELGMNPCLLWNLTEEQRRLRSHSQWQPTNPHPTILLYLPPGILNTKRY